MFHLPTMRMSSLPPPSSTSSLFQRYVIAIITTPELSTITACTLAGFELIPTHIQRIFTFRVLSIQPPRSQTLHYVHMDEFGWNIQRREKQVVGLRRRWLKSGTDALSNTEMPASMSVNKWWIRIDMWGNLVILPLYYIFRMPSQNGEQRHHASSCPSFRMEQLGFHWTDFHEIWYFMMFRKSVRTLRGSTQSDKNNGYFIWRLIHIIDPNSLSSSQNE